jgi:hypothetical protein
LKDGRQLGVGMISAIELENFQTFSKNQRARLAPLTLIFGPNSAGKSSVIRSLRFLAENLQPSHTRLQSLKFSTGALNLQSYQNIVHKHNEDLEMRLVIETTEIEKARHYDARGYLEKKSLMLGAQIARTEFTFSNKSIKDTDQPGRLEKLRLIGLRRERNAEPSVTYNMGFLSSTEESESYLSPDPHDLEKYGPLDLIALEFFEKDSTDRDWNGYLAASEVPSATDNVRNLDLLVLSLNGLSPTVDYLGGDFFEEMSSQADTDEERETFVGEYEDGQMVANALKFFFETHFEGMSDLVDFDFVGPLREIPEQITSSSIDDLRVPSNLDNRPRSRFDLTGTNSEYTRSRTWFSKLTEGRFEWESGRLSLNGVPLNLFANSIRDTRSDTSVSFSDVGVGLSQIIPVIKSAFSLKSEIKFIEQPELHLHPRMQSELGDMFIDAAGLADLSFDSQLIVETHSENLILRVQRRIREKSIRAEDVSILYVDYPSDSGSTIREIRLSDDGNFIDAWPQSFVDLRLDDLL